jgi:hypothetical protein
MLSNKHVRKPNQIIHQGQTYQRLNNFTNVTYSLQNAPRQTFQGSLVDGGANDGMSGNDVGVLKHTLYHADISGLAVHAVKDRQIVTAAACISISRGVFLSDFHQYFHLGTGKTIHSANKIRHFGVMICEIPRVLNGKKHMHQPGGYVISHSDRNGLAYMDKRKPSDQQLNDLPHVFFTSDAP